jgi:hypothetical protein
VKQGHYFPHHYVFLPLTASKRFPVPWENIMAASSFVTNYYTSKQFLEGSAAILFGFSQAVTKVCLLHYLARDEHISPRDDRTVASCGSSTP